MLRFKSKTISTRDRVLAVVERAFQFLLGVVVVGVIYRYCWIDVSDPFKCSALQNQGEWLDPGTKWNLRDAFKSWQPPGCVLHEYTNRDIQDCFQKKRLVFIGDSTTRQIFWAVAKKMDQERAQSEIEVMLDRDEKHTDLEFESDGIRAQFVWDPWLNSTKLAEELELFKAYSAKSEESQSAGLLLLGTPGLWYARHGQENYFKEFRSSIDAIIPYMDHLSENDTSLPVPMTLASRQDSPNLLLLAPIQVPRYEALSPSRVETMTPEKIDQMNDYVQQVSAHARADVVWSYSLMTWNRDSPYEESGLHVVENVAKAKAEVLLNLRCNADGAAKGFPFDRTCCSNYTQPGSAQWTLILGGMLILPAILFSRRKHVVQIGRMLPQSEVMTALTVFGLIICYCFYTDRTQIFDKVHKRFQTNQFLSASGAALLVGILSIRRSKSPTTSAKAPQDIDLLPREQTDEWKGWMQAIVLIYHYTNASSHLGIYQIIRLFIAAYLFMTGYGHTMFFLKSEDYSFKRCAAVLIRLNLLSCVLPYMMRTNYLFYYFAPLVSFWFLVICFTLKIGHRHNSNLTFLLGKVLLSAILTTAFTKIPGVLEFVGTVLQYTCSISWDITEWRFRTSLDLYIVYIGMIIAALSLRSSRLQSGLVSPKTVVDDLIQLTIRSQLLFRAALIALALGLPPGMWGLLRKSHTKEDYNWWQPYISVVPVLCYIVLRNALGVFRNYHFAVFAWLGRCSLETYILQYHIWLAADTKGLLRIGLWDSRIETLMLTVVFFWISWHTAEATQTLTRWIVGDTAVSSRRISEVGDVVGEKNSPYLLPKVKSEDEHSAIPNDIFLTTKILTSSWPAYPIILDPIGTFSYANADPSSFSCSLSESSFNYPSFQRHRNLSSASSLLRFEMSFGYSRGYVLELVSHVTEEGGDALLPGYVQGLRVLSTHLKSSNIHNAKIHRRPCIILSGFEKSSSLYSSQRQRSDATKVDMSSSLPSGGASAMASTDANARPPSLSDALTIVTIEVGIEPHRKSFLVYKEFACHHSPVLKAAFNSPFTEGQSQTMIISDVSHGHIFGYVQHWMYTGKLSNGNEESPITLSTYCQIWALADQLLIVPLQNEVVEEIFENRHAHEFSYQDISLVYQHTTPDSPLRKLVVDIFAFETSGAISLLQKCSEDAEEGEGDEEGQEMYPLQFVCDIAVALMEFRNPEMTVARDGSRDRKVVQVTEYLVSDPELSSRFRGLNTETDWSSVGEQT